MSSNEAPGTMLYQPVTSRQARCLINCERSARHDANSRDSPGEKKFRASRAVSPGEIGPHIMKRVY